MGLKDLLGGSAARVRPVSLKHGETELCREVASVRPGTLTSVGGDLVLTDRRLVFTPLETTDPVGVLTWVLDRPAAPDGSPVPPSVVSVSADGDGGWLKPPTIVVSGNDGSTTEIGVLAGRRSMNRDRSNVVARDRMLAAIRSALEA